MTPEEKQHHLAQLDELLDLGGAISDNHRARFARITHIQELFMLDRFEEAEALIEEAKQADFRMIRWLTCPRCQGLMTRWPDRAELFCPVCRIAMSAVDFARMGRGDLVPYREIA